MCKIFSRHFCYFYLELDISCQLSPKTICMKYYQIWCSGKNRKKISISGSAEFSQRVIKVKLIGSSTTVSTPVFLDSLIYSGQYFLLKLPVPINSNKCTVIMYCYHVVFTDEMRVVISQGQLPHS